MKKLLSLLTLGLLMSCGGKTTKLNLKIENLEKESKVTVSIMDTQSKQLEIIDSADFSKENNSKLFSFNMKEAGFVVVNVSDDMTQYSKELFLAVGDNANISLDYAQGLEFIEFSGSDVLNQFNDIIKEISQMKSDYMNDYQSMQEAKASNDTKKVEELEKQLEINKEKIKKIPYTFFKEHKNSELSPWVFIYCSELNASLVDENLLREMVSEMGEKIKETTWGKFMMKYYSTIRGNELKNFELKDRNDKMVTLNSFKGKKVYVRFWIKGFEENLFPFLQTLHDKYEDKLGIITIYIGNEQDKPVWLDIISESKNTWIDLFGNMDIVEEYVLNSPFSSFLLDEKGVILGKDFNDTELIDKLQEIMI